jgi:hypothetical protein
MKIKIVYFSYLLPNKWESIVLEQLESLYNVTTLYENADIYMSVIDTTMNQTELQKLQNILMNKYNKIKLVNIFSENVYEYPGIKTVYELSSMNEDEYILYFHSKGMSSNQHSTRHILFEYTIKNYKIILEEMEKNKDIDTSSIIPCINGFGYYNFFWARSSFVAKYCSKPESTEEYIKHERFTWEMWLGNHYAHKNFIKTYSPLICYNQVYDEVAACILMDLLHYNTDFELLRFKDTKIFDLIIMNKYKNHMSKFQSNKFIYKSTNNIYFKLYDTLFSSIRKSAKNVLEIGKIYEGNMKLLRDFIPNAYIYGVESYKLNFKNSQIKNDHNIRLFENKDGYDDAFIKNTFKDNNIKFDLMIHACHDTLEQNIDILNKYTPLLSDIGILIIEGIKDINWCNALIETVPMLNKYIKIYDMRENNNSPHDRLFVMNKNI